MQHISYLSEIREKFFSVEFISTKKKFFFFFYVLLTVHLSIILDNDQLDAHLLYFTISLS